MKPIARIHSDFATKFGIPRQSGVVESLQAEIVFEPEFRSREAVRGLDGYSHIWLIWEFSENVDATWSPTVRPPRLGGNVRMGVFARAHRSGQTRSVCHACVWNGSSFRTRAGRCSTSPEQT